MDASPTLAHGKDKFYDAELGIYKKTGNKSSEGAMEMDERIFKSKVYSRVILYFCYSLPHCRTVLSSLLIRPICTLSLRMRAMYILIWTGVAFTSTLCSVAARL